MTTHQDLTIRQGETWSYTYAHATDLSGHSARMSIKADWSSDAVAYLSTGADADGGSIAIDGTDVTLSMTAAQTTALLLSVDAMSETILYDLEIVSGAGIVTRALEGRVHVLRGVTG